MDEEEYLEYLQRLSRYAEQLGVTYVYTVVLDGETVRFTASSDTPEELAKGTYTKQWDAYDDASEKLELALRNRTVEFDT
jgi:hypothetical protein